MNWKVVVVKLTVDQPGVCYSGFISKQNVLDWLKDEKLDDPNIFRWIIFNGDREIIAL